MPDLVRVVIGDVEKNVGRGFAKAKGLTVLNEPTHTGDGRPRPATRSGGRPVKKKTSVAKEAAAKQAVTEPAENQKEQDQ